MANESNEPRTPIEGLLSERKARFLQIASQFLDTFRRTSRDHSGDRVHTAYETFCNGIRLFAENSGITEKAESLLAPLSENYNGLRGAFRDLRAFLVGQIRAALQGDGVDEEWEEKLRVMVDKFTGYLGKTRESLENVMGSLFPEGSQVQSPLANNAIEAGEGLNRTLDHGYENLRAAYDRRSNMENQRASGREGR